MPALLERPRTVYRTDLIREVPFSLRDDLGEAAGDGNNIDGYGAVFDQPTHISSWEGDFDEDIAKGAFRKTLRENTPVMQYDHGRHPLIGSIPLGRWDIAEEDDLGLHCVGRLSDNWLIQPVRDAIAGPDGNGGGITGMSFRFSVVRDVWVDKDGKKIKDEELFDLLWYGAGDRGPIKRTLQEVKVSEVGPVAWPAYTQTSVGVRSAESPFIIDLGALDLRTERGRTSLARAVALADRAAPREVPERERVGAPPAATRLGGVDTATMRDQEPQSTTGTAGSLPSGSPSTVPPPVGEHSSARPRRVSMRDRAAEIRAREHAIRRTMPKG